MFYTLFRPIFWSPKNWITHTGEHYLITKYNDPFSKIYQTVTHFSQTQILKTCFYEPDLFLCSKPISLLFNLPLSMATSSFLEFSTLELIPSFSSAIGLIFYGLKSLHLLNSRLRRSAMHHPQLPGLLFCEARFQTGD